MLIDRNEIYTGHVNTQGSNRSQVTNRKTEMRKKHTTTEASLVLMFAPEPIGALRHWAVGSSGILRIYMTVTSSMISV